MTVEPEKTEAGADQCAADGADAARCMGDDADFQSPHADPIAAVILACVFAATGLQDENMLAAVQGVGPPLAAYCLVASLGGVFYWTSFHAYFAAAGDREHRGHQIGAREALAALLAISKGRVSQLHRAALLLLKKRMRERGHFRLER